jgi:copper(I)-binding protein
MQTQNRSFVAKAAGLAFAALIVLVLGGVLGGCAGMMPATQPMGGAEGGQMGDMPAAAPLPTPEPGKLAVLDVRARPAPLEGGNGAAYLVVLNGLDAPVRLAGVTGEAAAAIELHETTEENGVMKMEPHPEGFEVPAGGTLELKPGGKHVMLLGLVQPLVAGDTITLTLNFEGQEPMTLPVPVVEMEAAMPGMDHGSMETPQP